MKKFVVVILIFLCCNSVMHTESQQHKGLIASLCPFLAGFTDWTDQLHRLSFPLFPASVLVHEMTAFERRELQAQSDMTT